MHRQSSLRTILALGFGTLFVLLSLLVTKSGKAAPSMRYVSPDGNCGVAVPCYTNIQAALTDSAADDEIRVAEGVYTDVHAFTAMTQAVYITKSITIRGGYTTTNWTQPDFAGQPTILDVQQQGQVINISGDITAVLEGLRLMNGNGGGINVSYPSMAVTLISSCQILSNTSGGSAGLYNPPSSMMIVTNSIIGWNSATADFISAGGGIGNGGFMELYSVTVMGNDATGGYGGLGGGIYNYGVMNVFTTSILNNQANGSRASGGGIANIDGGVFNLNNSAVLSNASGIGGGIYNYIYSYGQMMITNVTVSGNHETAGGTIVNLNGAMTVTNATIVSDTGTIYGALVNEDLFSIGLTPTLEIRNTILAHNTNLNCEGTFHSLGHNLDSGNSCGFKATGDLTDTNPNLWAIGYYGGSTLSYRLPLGSPAVDAGGSVGCPATDQRGVLRPQGQGCDIGAFEVEIFKWFVPMLLRN